MSRLTAFSETVAAIYQTTLQPELWSRALEVLCDYLAAHAATVSYHDVHAGQALLAYEHGTNPEWSQRYHDEFAGLNPLIPPLMAGPVGKPGLICDRMPTEEFHRSRLYREWCVPQEYEDFMDMVVYRDSRRVGAVCCTRLRRQPRFDIWDLEAFEALAGHIKRALEISNLFEIRKVEHRMFERVVSGLAAGVALIDHAGKVLHLNPSLEAWLKRQDRVIRSADRLSLPGVNTRALIDGVERNQVFTKALEASNTNGAVAITALPLDNGLSQAVNQPITVILTGTDFAPEPNPQLLKKTFGLTGAELRVLLLLLDGSGSENAANVLGVSMATVRTHIAHLLQKTDARSQADMLLKVGALSGPFRPPLPVATSVTPTRHDTRATRST